MVIYKVASKPISVPSGQVKLSKQQADARKENLKRVEGEEDVYEIVNPLSFKQGEVFGYSEEISKGQEQFLEKTDEEVGSPAEKKDDEPQTLAQEEADKAAAEAAAKAKQKESAVSNADASTAAAANENRQRATLAQPATEKKK